MATSKEPQQPAKELTKEAMPTLPPGMKVVGDYYIGEEEARPKQRGYTTRAKEEARKAEVKFTGLVRRWEKRWVKVGHMRVLRWEHVDASGIEAERSRVPTPFAPAEAEPPRKRARQ